MWNPACQAASGTVSALVQELALASVSESVSALVQELVPVLLVSVLDLASRPEALAA